MDKLEKLGKIIKQAVFSPYELMVHLWNRYDILIDDINNKIITEIDKKPSQGGNYEGSWWGIKNPIFADPGIANIVNMFDDAFKVLNTDKKDGVIDATTVLQAWFNSFEDGREYTLPKGTYKVTQPLYINDKKHFKLNMQGEIVPYTDSSGTNAGRWELPTNDPTAVINISNCRNFVIVPNVRQTDRAKFGNGNIIYMHDCYKWTICDGSLEIVTDTNISSERACIRIGSNCKRGKILDMHYISGYIGVYAGGGIFFNNWYSIDDIVIDGCTFQANKFEGEKSLIGVSVDCPANKECTNFKITNNTFDDYFSDAVEAEDAYYEGVALANTSYNIVSNNIMRNCNEGFHMEQDSYHNKISKNIIINPYYCGMEMGGAIPTIPSYNSIDDNTILCVTRIPKAAAIAMNGKYAAGGNAKKNSITNNKVINKNAAAIGYGILGADIDQYTISGNIFEGKYGTVIFAQMHSDSVKGSIIVNNSLEGTSTTGINYISNYSSGFSLIQGNVNLPVLHNGYLFKGDNPTNITTIAHTAVGLIEVDFMRQRVAKNSMNDGTSIKVTAWGHGLAGTTICLYFGPTKLYNSIQSTVESDWIMDAVITRINSNTLRGRMNVYFNGQRYDFIFDKTGIDFTIENMLKCTSYGNSAGGTLNTQYGMDIKVMH